jgi:hypothetical protein
MTFTRLLVLGDSHPPESMAAHLASSGALKVGAATSNRVPETMDGTALWVHTNGATRLHNAGIELQLLAPGPSWLSTVPGHLLGRRVLCTTAGKLPSEWNGPGVFRLAEHKYGGLGLEQTYATPDAFLAQLAKHRHRQLELVAAAHVIASTPIEYTDRYRVFIADGQISASTRITGPDHSKWNDAYEGDDEDRTTTAEHFAQVVVDATVWHQPPGFRIDVGLTAEGAWQLISVGPSWAADFHRANPTGVLNSILSGQAPDYPHWKWVPDDLFQHNSFPSWLAPAVAR